jgi:diphthamide synthase (EF-2-diphthine--ammonia ligase)
MDLKLGIAVSDTKFVRTYNKKDELKTNGFKWRIVGVGSQWMKEAKTEEELNEIIDYVKTTELDLEIVAYDEYIGEYNDLYTDRFDKIEGINDLIKKEKEIRKTIKRK